MDTETDVAVKDEQTLTEEEDQQTLTDASVSVADPTGYTPDKQALDQERANARREKEKAERAREELATLTEAYDEARNQLSEYKTELAALKQAKQEEEDRLDEMDPEMVDEKIVKNFRILENRLAKKESQLADVVKKVELYEQHQAELDAQQRNAEAREAVLTTVEEVLSEAGIVGAAKYRSEANKLADEMVDSGEVPQPKTFDAGVKLMSKCYLQVKARKDKSAAKPVSVDTGKAGGGVIGKTSGIKPGRLADVKAQMLKDRSWLEED